MAESTKWQGFQLRLPAGVTEVGQTAAAGLSSVKTFLQAARAASEVARRLYTDPASPSAAAVNRAVQAGAAVAEAAVAGVLDDAGAYVLVVPIPKKGLLQLVPNPDAEDGTNFFDLPLGAILLSVPEGTQARLRQSSAFEQLTDPSQVFTGGNAYFVRTVGEALFDDADAARPQFAAETYWAYALVVAGAVDLAGVLPLARFLDRIVENRSMLGATRGISDFVPQNVRARVSERGRNVVVEWDPVPASRLLASFGRATVVPVEFAVIRSTDYRVATVTSVAQLFGTGKLAAGRRGLYGAEVVSVRRYDGVTSRYLDDTRLAPDKDHYYLVAFRSRIRPDGAETARELGLAETGAHEELEFDKVAASPAVRVSSRSRPSSAGRPPDWFRVPSLASVLPGVDRVVDLGLGRLRNFARSAATANEINDAFAEALDREVDRYATVGEELVAAVSQVTNLALSTRELAGAAVKVGYGQGDASAFFAEVVDALSDLSDDGRPAFDAGDEYVTGAVVVASAPDPEALAARLAFLKAIFAPAVGDPQRDGIESVGPVPAVPAATVDPTPEPSRTFDDALGAQPPGTADAACTTDPPPSPPSFDDGMNPEDS